MAYVMQPQFQTQQDQPKSPSVCRCRFQAPLNLKLCCHGIRFLGFVKDLSMRQSLSISKPLSTHASNVIDTLGSYHAIEVRKEGEWIWWPIEKFQFAWWHRQEWQWLIVNKSWLCIATKTAKGYTILKGVWQHSKLLCNTGYAAQWSKLLPNLSLGYWGLSCH